MKVLVALIVSLVLNIFTTFSQEKQKPTVFIMGTMHEVPKIVKNSYKPLLKIAKKYTPDAIYVERQRPEDSLSLINYESKWFLPYSDSIAQIFKNIPSRTEQLKKTSVLQMSKSDFNYLKQYFAAQKDKANWSYYTYLYRYGIIGSKKPLRNENGDLTAKLAIAMDINYIYAMDHQHETAEYSKKWKECVIASKKDGEIKYLIQNNKKEYRRAILPAIFGNLGRHTNKLKTIKRYLISNRFTFRKTPCAPCIEGANIWDRRNDGIAQNIGVQILKHHHKKAIVIIGAGHVIGVRKSLESQFPEINVMIMNQ
ncbi:DUF5694 domain-containing protein [Aquimarina sp. 2201CG5-10]|uniref:DUF5694 domain-containing protein n=1 Tax=Aquimarina callyspongiae TaxID=3098150 RepID=UPI002AB33AD0|nr:DUF5694 domain-containing protein [Aquimarina sp. 2201CG5-10]MDY8138883.1 DUF5694 domain-containing protein [Aquimarina sp. 2201CG5-10]